MSGVININKYIGKVYNNYTIISFKYFINYKRSRQPFYECVCVCGYKSIIGLWSLRSLKNKMCNKCKSIKRTLPNSQASINMLFNQYIKQAKNRNYEFKISKDKFIELTSKNCYYCNSAPINKFKNQNNSGTYIYNGLDRIDNNKGYIENNIVTCCKNCNRAKSDMKIEEFLKLITNIYNNCAACES